MNIEYVLLYKSMVKRKQVHTQREKSLEENLKQLEDEIKSIKIDADSGAASGADPQKEIERKREELIKLAEDRQFEKNVNPIKKVSNAVIEKYYRGYERKRMQKRTNV